MSDLSLPTVSALRRSIDRERYLAEPHLWVQERLGEHVWSKQREILHSVFNHRYTAVQSCHSSGKSFLSARLALMWLDIHPRGEAFVVTSAPTASQVRAILWREIGRAYTKLKPKLSPLDLRMNQTEMWWDNPHGEAEMVAFGRKPAEFDTSAFQGIHARNVLLILDEAGGIPQSLFDAGDSLISNEHSHALAVGNPDDPGTYFAEICKPGSGWNVIQISAFDTPNFTSEPIPERTRDLLISRSWAEDKLRRWGADNPLYLSKVLGQFPESSDDGLFPLRSIRQAQERDLESTITADDPVILGVDVGAGGNRSVTCHRRGPVARIIRRDQIPNTMHTLGNVILDLKSTRATSAQVDATGIGQGVVDRAAEIATDHRQRNPHAPTHTAALVEPVKVGLPAIDPTTFFNLRAEAYWRLRERFVEGLIDIEATDLDLAAQLADIRYKPNSKGQIQIESKDQMRGRGRQSPDDADALMLAYLSKPRKKKKKAGTWGPRKRTY